MLFLEPRERGGSGPENTNALPIRWRKILREPPRPSNRIFQIRIAHNHIGKGGERRIRHHAAEMQLALVERKIVLAHGILNRIVLRIIRLNQHAAWKLAASRAPGNLRQKLKRALGGPEV